MPRTVLIVSPPSPNLWRRVLMCTSTAFAVKGVAPDLVEYLVAAQYNSFVFQKVAKHIKFLKGQDNRLIVYLNNVLFRTYV